MTITETNITEGLGELAGKFKIEAFSNGNFQVTIADMGEIRDYDKICLLKEALEKLVDAEVISDPNECFRLSWKTRKVDDEGKPIFRPYPTIWVNQPGRVEAAVNRNEEAVEAVRSEMRQEMSELKALIQAAIPGDKTPKKAMPKKATAQKNRPKKAAPKKAVEEAEPDSAPVEEAQGDEVPFGF